MFFVSEEFLRKYQETGEVNQTIGEAVQPGEGLFDNVAGKREHNIRRREEAGHQKSSGSES